MQINAITSLKNIHQNLSAIVKVNNLHDSTDIDTILDYHDLVQDLSMSEEFNMANELIPTTDELKVLETIC